MRWRIVIKTSPYLPDLADLLPSVMMAASGGINALFKVTGLVSELGTVQELGFLVQCAEKALPSSVSRIVTLEDMQPKYSRERAIKISMGRHWRLVRTHGFIFGIEDYRCWEDRNTSTLICIGNDRLLKRIFVLVQHAKNRTGLLFKYHPAIPQI